MTDLARVKLNARLGELGRHLCMFAETSRAFSDSQKRLLKSDGRIQKLLDELEKALAYTVSSGLGEIVLLQSRVLISSRGHALLCDKPKAYPTLIAIASALRRATGGDREVTRGLLSIQNKLRAALSRRRIDFEAMFAAPRGCRDAEPRDEQDDPSVAGLATTKHDAAGYTSRAKLLAKILVNCAICSCPGRQGEMDSHWTRLRLKPVYEAGVAHCCLSR